MNDSRNIGLWYTKDYYNNVKQNYIKSGLLSSEGWDEKLFNGALYENYLPSLSQIKSVECEHKFELKTIYPGLACGLGYKHEMGVSNEFKLGLYFDYTSGLPVIPGSSLKGVFKHAFEDSEYISDIIDTKFKKIEINKLKDDIFEGTKDNNLKINTYSRDCFFDAEIVASIQEKPLKTDENMFLTDDYITCHQNSKDPQMTSFTEPNPVKFLKVRSNVIFQFKFRLHDSLIGELKINPENKIDLFKRILLDLGVGAKTNVGYGQFIE